MRNRTFGPSVVESKLVKPVRIAFVITELEFGGAERCLANLVTSLDRTRFDPMVCALKPRPVAGQDSLVRRIEEAAIPVHFLNLRSPASLLFGLTKLKRLFRQHETEVVQTFLFHANVIGAFAARSVGVKRIVSGIRVADPSRWRMRLERFAMRPVDDIVCVSQSVADQVATKGGYPRSKLRVIPNGIELSSLPIDSSFDWTTLGIPPNRRILLCVGRLHKQKGFDWLLEFAPELLNRLPEHDLVIVGDGPERRALRDITARLSIQDRVHFLGWRADVSDLMNAADVLLLPSRWEGMPNVLIEAMGVGLPAVATAVEGVREVLGTLANSQMVNSGDVAAFISAVCRIAASPDERQKLVHENHERIRAEFSLHAMIAKYEAMYSLRY